MPEQETATRSEDKYDAMALISGPIAGLRPEQLPGLAHIFRQIANDEREACAADLESLAAFAEKMKDVNAWRALKSAADAMRARE